MSVTGLLMDAVSDSVSAPPVVRRLVILGKQGAGKGTQCELLVAKYGIAHISTGDMLRAAVDDRTEFGLAAQSLMEAGELVGDDVILGIVTERLSEPDAQAGFLLDGFPRTDAQADGLLELLSPNRIDCAIELDVPDAIVTQRMLDRGRDDDTLTAIARRLELYEAETAPLRAMFKFSGVLVTVDGLGTPAEVHDRIVAAVESSCSQLPAAPC